MPNLTIPPTPEEMQGLTILSAPSLSPAYFQVTSNSNEVVVICNQMMPMVDTAGQLTAVGRLTPLLLLRLSPQAAKDLLVVLKDNVEMLEKEYGQITTALTKSFSGGSDG